MDGHYFVSYSRVDGEEFAGRLADQLVAGPPSYAVWLDVRDMQPGVDWDDADQRMRSRPAGACCS